MSLPAEKSTALFPELRDLSVETTPESRRRQLYSSLRSLIFSVLITAAIMIQVFPEASFFVRLLLFSGTILTIRLTGGLVVFCGYLGTLLIGDKPVTQQFIDAAASMPESVLTVAGLIYLFQQQRTLKDLANVPLFTELGRLREQIQLQRKHNSIADDPAVPDTDHQKVISESDRVLQGISLYLTQLFIVMLCCIAAVLLLLVVPRGRALNTSLRQALAFDPGMVDSSLMLTAMVGIFCIFTALMTRLLTTSEARMTARSDQIKLLFPDLMLMARATLRRRRKQNRMRRWKSDAADFTEN